VILGAVRHTPAILSAVQLPITHRSVSRSKRDKEKKIVREEKFRRGMWDGSNEAFMQRRGGQEQEEAICLWDLADGHKP